MKLKQYNGYHGTEKSFADRIIQTSFVVNTRHQGSLGTGIYFLEENKDLTREYARFRHPNKIIKILDCKIEVSENEVFDTTTPEHREIYKVYKDIIREMMKENGYDFQYGYRNSFDGAVYDYLAKDKGYLLIRAETFTPSIEERELKIRSNVPNGVELCLRNPIKVIDKQIV
ncbi:hypothetical protein [Oceanobacillus sp. 1P07AA]|uniref:hypothetical protein n=1 Tax=Oceanobacillus sp. 1P07AA TaxID=3132293 RepID=UPI0039A6927F